MTSSKSIEYIQYLQDFMNTSHGLWAWKKSGETFPIYDFDLYEFADGQCSAVHTEIDGLSEYISGG
jgi:hypothetical protein